MRFARGRYLCILSPASRSLATATLSIARNIDRTGISLFAGLLSSVAPLRAMRLVFCGIFYIGRVSSTPLAVPRWWTGAQPKAQGGLHSIKFYLRVMICTWEV